MYIGKVCISAIMPSSLPSGQFEPSDPMKLCIWLYLSVHIDISLSFLAVLDIFFTDHS